MRKKFSTAIIVPFLAVALGGCGTSQISASGLWEGVRGRSAMEADPATSLDDLVEESTLVVRARITRITRGPDLVMTPPEGEVREPSLIFHLDVNETEVGTAPSSLKVHVQSYGDDLAPTDAPPQDEYLWFLKPAGIEDFYMTSKFAGVIGDLDGDITTVSEESTGVVSDSWDSLDDVVAEVDRLEG